MAEVVVCLLIEKLLSLLNAEATLLQGVHDEVRSINKQLQMINAYLKDADMQAEVENTPNSVKVWVKQMREEVAFPMEDVIDRYSLKVVEHGQRHGVYGIVTEINEKLKTVTHGHGITSEILLIRKSLEQLSKDKERFNLNPCAPESSSGATTSSHYTRLGAHYVEDSELVGVKDTRKVLTDWLSRKESKRSLMVVVGAAGIGKTAIVKNVYKQEKQKNFKCHAWIDRSRLQNEDMLLRAIIRSINEEHHNAIATMEGSLIDKLREYLNDKRYMIVFDDVRQSNFWDVLRFAIPNNSKSSRVMITTRDAGVADYCRSDDAPVAKLELKPLPLNDALELFHRKAFQSEQEEYPEELKKLSEDFVEKCDRVPLAIVAIAGLLSTKMKTFIEWKNVYSSLGSWIATDPLLKSIYQVASESYHDLPSHLKLCFLYFGLFPENYSISCTRLIRLWVAEAFVKENRNENISMEEIAEKYLEELFRRCLVQVSRVDLDGKPKSCRVHNLMHKFILRKGEEQNFCQVIRNDISCSDLNLVGRRVSIQMNNNNENAAMKRPKRSAKWDRVRSCFVFNAENLPKPLRKSFFSRFELLTVLDFQDAHLCHLTEEVGDLLNLRYLSIRNTNIILLPKSIGKLQNLQTLDLKLSGVRELPREINMLIKLRHLLAYYYLPAGPAPYCGLNNLQGVKMEEGIENLESLQKLSFLDATHASIIDKLKRLTQLRKLGILKLAKKDGEALCSAIENMTHLYSLSIGAMTEHEILNLQSLKNPPKSLQRLYLCGRLENLPDWIPKLKDLISLYLKWSGLKEDPLYSLKDLSKLAQLELYDTYEGEELHFKNGWLKGLKVLHLEGMQNLNTIRIDKGALPNLEKLKIGRCPQLVRVPNDVKNLKSLKCLHLYDMPDQFINRIMGPQGEDHGIVSNIPLVQCSKDDHFDTLHSLDS